MRAFLPILALALLTSTALAGCGGGGGGDSSTTTTRPHTTTPPVTTTGASTTTTGPATTTTSGTTTTPPPTTSPTSTTPPPTTTPPAPDTAAPVISSVVVTVAINGATISFDVTDESATVTSRVEYGTTVGLGTTSVTAGGVGAKSIALANLNSGTTYQFKVVSVDLASNVGQTAIAPFTTTNVPPAISGVLVTRVTQDSFTVQWTQAGGAETQSRVEYGGTTSYGSLTTVQGGGGGGSKTASVSGLAQNALYHFRVIASSGSGSAQSADQTQKTAVLREITINGNQGPASFSPAATNIPAGALVFFKIHYADASGMIHNWGLLDSTGAAVAGFQSPDMSDEPPTSRTDWEMTTALPLLAGTYTMRCSYHYNAGPPPTGMFGTVTVT
ncbi:MAG TPA: fibronectin type III domain-containing protein [Candidatus Thermoplasmatota archaeon]|nr:fibronectin type III domain-containing protein [Candidatus Thermoplasmatota archaeon]